jgi:hypothetical protein
MTIWIDADSCPKDVRDVIVRAGTKRGIHCVFVANKKIPLPSAPFISFVKVPEGADQADSYIKEHLKSGDIVITRDILLAADLVPRGITVLNDRGEVFTRENIGEKVSLRNISLKLRQEGLLDNGDKTFGKKEIKAFADTFDRELTRKLKKR